jgi:hypothetical protein
MGKIHRRAVYVATIVAMLAMTGGFAAAVVLAPATPVNQTVNSYQGTSTSTVDFPTSPTLGISTSGNPTSVLTSVSASAPGGATYKFSFCANSGCTMAGGDFDEVFTFTSSATVAGGASNTFTVYTTFGSGPSTQQQSLSYGSTVLHTGADTVEIYIDYGATPPAGGIASLDVIVTGT